MASAATPRLGQRRDSLFARRGRGFVHTIESKVEAVYRKALLLEKRRLLMTDRLRKTFASRPSEGIEAVSRQVWSVRRPSYSVDRLEGLIWEL
jgi:hypothetical protein